MDLHKLFGLEKERTVDDILMLILHYTFINQSHHTKLVVLSRIVELNVMPNA